MKKLKINMILCLICLTSISVNILAQPVDYFDDYYGNFATSDSRVVTTINEIENSDEVHIEVILAGELNIGLFQINLFYDPNVVFPIMGPGGNEITTPLNGNGKILEPFLWFNPALTNVNSWRGSASGQVNPHVNEPCINIVAGGNEGLTSNMSLAAGEILEVFTLHFKKLPGKTLSNNTFSYNEKVTAPQVRNLFSRGESFLHMSYYQVETVNSDIFARRVPSSVKTLQADVKGTSVNLIGLANSEGLQKIPVIPRVCGGLDWDTLVTTGFIFTENDLHLTIDKYSKKIKKDSIEYDFPSIENGSFVLGTDTLFIVSQSNTGKKTRIAMEKTIADLFPEKKYYAYAYMKYKFQTTHEYPVLGERVEFTTGNGIIDFEMDIYAPIIACNHEQTINIEYTINIEDAQYKIIFSPESMGAGFVSINEYMSLPESGIEVNLPYGVPAGNYAATIYVRFESLEKYYDIEFNINSLPNITATSETELFLNENDEIYLFVEVEGEAEYQWYFEGNIIYGATESFYSDQFNTTKEGIYMAEIFNQCGSVLHFFSVNKNPNVGTVENETKGWKFTVYPNPVNHDERLAFLLQLPDNEMPDAIVLIYDMNGRKVEEYKIHDYKTEVALNLAVGTYLAKAVLNSGKQFVCKFIIQ